MGVLDIFRGGATRAATPPTEMPVDPFADRRERRARSLAEAREDADAALTAAAAEHETALDAHREAREVVDTAQAAFDASGTLADAEALAEARRELELRGEFVARAERRHNSATERLAAAKRDVLDALRSDLEVELDPDRVAALVAPLDAQEIELVEQIVELRMRRETIQSDLRATWSRYNQTLRELGHEPLPHPPAAATGSPVARREALVARVHGETNDRRKKILTHFARALYGGLTGAMR